MTKESQEYTVTKMTSERVIATDLLSFANQQNIVHGILEFDVTDVLQAIDDYEKQNGKKISFTAFMINCLGKAVSENKRIQAMKKGRKKIIVFEDVDVAGFIEAERDWKKVPLVYIFRKVNERDLLSINSEMQKIKKQRTKEYNTQNSNLKLYTLVPKFLRNFFLKRRYQRDPFFVKKWGGTVTLTSIGMFTKGGGWGIPISLHPTYITLGGIEEKPVVQNGEIVIRKVLSVTASFNHDLIDGAPATRFTKTFKKLVENGYQLLDLLPSRKVSER